MLFTGKDPAIKLQAAEACTHEGEEDCDCPPVSIEIPAVLAYHATTFSQSLGNLHFEFSEFPTATDKNLIVRQDRLPTGQKVQAQRNTNERYRYSQDWDDYRYWRDRELEKILDRWYRQGITLHHS